MNVELIKLSRKAAREWTGTDGYNQASQLGRIASTRAGRCWFFWQMTSAKLSSWR